MAVERDQGVAKKYNLAKPWQETSCVCFFCLSHPMCKEPIVLFQRSPLVGSTSDFIDVSEKLAGVITHNKWRALPRASLGNDWHWEVCFCFVFRTCQSEPPKQKWEHKHKNGNINTKIRLAFLS